MPLVLVDSETKAKTISAQLETTIEKGVVMSAPMLVGHEEASQDLHAGKSGFRFAPSEAGKKIVKMIDADLARDVIIAFDNDQVGDYWSWMLQGYFNASGNEKRVCRRVRFDGLHGDMSISLEEQSADFPYADGAECYIRSLFNRFLVRHLQRLIGTSTGPASLPLDYATSTILFLLAGRSSMIPPGTFPAGLKLKVKLSSNNRDMYAWLCKGPGVLENGFIADSAQVRSKGTLVDHHQRQRRIDRQSQQ